MKNSHHEPRQGAPKLKSRIISLCVHQLDLKAIGDWEAAIRSGLNDSGQMSEDAAQFMCMCRPIIVEKADSGRFTVIAGVRTFQIIREVFKPAFKLKAVELVNWNKDQLNELRLFDALLCPVIDIVDGNGLAIIANEFLYRANARATLEKFMNISGAEKLAKLIGTSVPTLHRNIQKLNRQARLKEDGSEATIGSSELTMLRTRND